MALILEKAQLANRSRLQRSEMGNISNSYPTGHEATGMVLLGQGSLLGNKSRKFFSVHGMWEESGKGPGKVEKAESYSGRIHSSLQCQRGSVLLILMDESMRMLGRWWEMRYDVDGGERRRKEVGEAVLMVELGGTAER
jgi:hypothetical protein